MFGQNGIVPVILVIVSVLVLGLGFYTFEVALAPKNDQRNQDILDEITHFGQPKASAEASATSTPTQNPLVAIPSHTPNITPTPIPKPELRLEIVEASENQYHLYAHWKNVPSPTSGDWLGLFPSKEKGDSPIADRIYTVSCAKKPETDFSKAPLAEGSCPMYTPLDNGNYEVRLYTNDSLHRIATSNFVQIHK